MRDLICDNIIKYCAPSLREKLVQAFYYKIVIKA